MEQIIRDFILEYTDNPWSVAGLLNATPHYRIDDSVFRYGLSKYAQDSDWQWFSCLENMEWEFRHIVPDATIDLYATDEEDQTPTYIELKYLDQVFQSVDDGLDPLARDFAEMPDLIPNPLMKTEQPLQNGALRLLEDIVRLGIASVIAAPKGKSRQFAVAVVQSSPDLITRPVDADLSPRERGVISYWEYLTWPEVEHSITEEPIRRGPCAGISQKVAWRVLNEICELDQNNTEFARIELPGCRHFPVVELKMAVKREGIGSGIPYRMEDGRLKPAAFAPTFVAYALEIRPSSKA
jgi:hypothetical protein